MILNKSLASMGQDEKFRMHDKWIGVNTAGAINWALVRRLVVWFTSTGLLVLAVILIWNRRLARELVTRRAAETNLRELSSEKDAMMGMLAHDLRNPLNVVLLCCSCLKLEGDLATTVQRIKRNAQRMTELISKLLSSNAIETGQFQAQPEDFVLATKIGEVVAGFRPGAASKGVALDFKNHAGDDARLHADATAVGQIAENLVSNALKFTPPGGAVEVSLLRDNGRLQLAVRDTGPGIREDEMERLFVKFARLSARPTAGEPTHGLGLSIVKKLAGVVGAELAVESKPGDGATFRVSFTSR